MKRLAVYCGSATPADPAFVESARQVGQGLARRGIGVVYGGGRLGLMGAMADAALEAGGEVIGVIPQALVSAEVAHRGCTHLHIVQTMHQRKALFTDLSDGFVTLPGGVGTMDELWEAISCELLLRSVDRLLSPDGRGGLHPSCPCGHPDPRRYARHFARPHGVLPAARADLRDEIDAALART
jgi:uncharacterized protein (TIGR00730 family)